MRRFFSLLVLGALLTGLAGCGQEVTEPSVPDEPLALETLAVEISKNGLSTEQLLEDKRQLPNQLRDAFSQAGVEIGQGTTLYPGVKIYEGCSVGADCILHAGAVIGADGFGFMPNAEGGFDKIPQLGNVIIEDHVEIGANTCIDRAKTDSTIIRRGVKLDNLIQIGHNVEIGENTVSSAQTGIAGTSKVGHNCFLAGQVGIADHVTVGNCVKVGSKSGIDKNVPDGEVRLGYPALPGMQYHRSSAVFKNLPELARRVNELEKQIKELNELKKQ